MRVNYEKLWLRCCELDLTVMEAVKKAGCSADLITRIKRGRNIQTTTLKRISDVLKVKPEELIVRGEYE